MEKEELMSRNYKRLTITHSRINSYISDLELKCIKKNIFFTGSDGYLGSRIKQRLIQAGHTIISWNNDLTQKIDWDDNCPAIDLIIHFGNSKLNIIALDKITENIYNLARSENCPIIFASSDSVKLDIPNMDDLINCEKEISYKDIKIIGMFNAEQVFLKLQKTTNLRVPLILDESILKYKPNSWYANISKNRTFYKDNQNISILSLDRFCTITLEKIYEVLKETGTKEKFNNEIFEYPSISLSVIDIISKINNGFWK